MTKKKTPLEIAAAQQAITGSAPVPWFMTSLVREKTEKTKKIDAPVKGEDAVLAEGSTTDFWKYLKKFMLNRQDLFKELLKDQIARSPYNMQEIGFRYVISAQVEDVLNEVINRVENFAQIVEKSKEETPKDDANNPDR